MTKILKGKSTIISLLFNGRFSHFLNPWHIILDLEKLTITIKKRNWFLIGFDTQTYAFRFIRNVVVDTHLFGADISIKVMGGKIEAFCISKRIAKRIEEILVQYNNQKGSKHIIFH
ncbi:MAG: hypothetical protein ACOCWG_05810 [bacterium]